MMKGDKTEGEGEGFLTFFDKTSWPTQRNATQPRIFQYYYPFFFFLFLPELLNFFGRKIHTARFPSLVNYSSLSKRKRKEERKEKKKETLGFAFDFPASFLFLFPSDLYIGRIIRLAFPDLPLQQNLYRHIHVCVISNLAGKVTMRRDWLLLPNLDQSNTPNLISSEQLIHGFGVNLITQFGSLVDSSRKRPKNLYASGTLALHESFNRLNKITGALFFWFSREKSSNVPQSKSKIYPSQIKHCIEKLKSDGRSMQVVLSRLFNMTIGKILREVQHNPTYGVLSLAGAGVPPFDNMSSKVFAESLPFASYGGNCRACGNIPISDIAWIRDTTEKQTGIDFPTFIEDNFNYTTELLVGTGSKTMSIMRFKTLNVYAFGVYIHPDSLCEKLGRKYASVPTTELKNNPNFLRDLLREDIHMTVRLVVNCNGLSISKVRKTFEKCLRIRLEKMNPETDYHCLDKFGSYFRQDIRIPMGTTIDFRKTTEGQLITEINGRHIGAVHSKDLCNAFFDMYVGELPVSIQAKQEIVSNVGGLIKRC